MATQPLGTRLVQTCDAMCGELRRAIGLTLFRLELERRTTPLIITLRADDPLAFDPRHEWMRHATPARIESPLMDGERRIGSLRIEDVRRAAYPEEARARAAAITTRYARELAELLEAAQL